MWKLLTFNTWQLVKKLTTWCRPSIIKLWKCDPISSPGTTWVVWFWSCEKWTYLGLLLNFHLWRGSSGVSETHQGRGEMPLVCTGRMTERESNRPAWESVLWALIPPSEVMNSAELVPLWDLHCWHPWGQWLVGTSETLTLVCLEMTQSSLPPTHPVPSHCVSSFCFLSCCCVYVLWLSWPIHPKEILPSHETTYWLASQLSVFIQCVHGCSTNSLVTTLLISEKC